MALQGTIDSFAMADVMRLLASSTKTGRLIVNGDRGSANLWFEAGRLVAGSSSSGASELDVIEIVFEVLRFETGSFIFEADAPCPATTVVLEVAPALQQAEAALAEWHEIVQVVPSLAHQVTLATMLPHHEVVVDQACWSSIVAVGSGTSVGRLGQRLGLGELPVSRLVRAMVAAGFVQVGEPLSPLTTDDLPAEAVDGASLPKRHPMDGVPEEWIEEEQARAVEDHVPPAGGEVALPSLNVAVLGEELFGSPPPAEEQSEAPDVNRSMSMLSSKAAQALAALADRGDAEPAPSVEVDEDEERARMLKFLGSV